MDREFTASCDRVECGIAILISDEDEKEYAVRRPLSDSLSEGGIYLCRESGGEIVSLVRLLSLEKKRREESRKMLERLFAKNG